MNTLYFTKRTGARILAAVALFSLIASLVPMQAFANHDPFGGVPQTSVLICHQQGNGGYQPNSPNISATGGNISVAGHEGHDADRNKLEDIIPPFHFDDNGTILSYPGKNWNASTEDMWARGACNGDGVVGPTTGTITIQKTVINDNGGTAVASSFTFKIDGVAKALNTPIAVSAGAHTVSEDAFAGYTAGSWSGACAANGSITVVAGQNYTCTITNDDNVPAPVYACSDALDNDLDTFVDFPNDPGCTSATDNDETDPVIPPVYACSDALDNDLDTFVDFPNDPGCTSATDNDETDPNGGGDTMTCDEPTAQNLGEEGACEYFVSQCSSQPTNLLVNASFEDPVVNAGNGTGFGAGFYGVFTSITGWSAPNGIELWNNILNVSSDLAQSTELDVAGSDVGPSTLSQPVVTIPGATYELSFDFAARSDNSAAVENSVVAGADLATVSASTNNTTFVTYGTIFVADASTDVSFTDVGTDNGVGTVIDNAVLCLVSLPQDGGGDNDALSCSITASDTSIRRGRSVDLDWTSLGGANSATLTGEDGVVTTVGTSGGVTIDDLDDDTTFTLTVTDGEDTESCSVSVNTTSGGGGGGGGNNNNNDEPNGDVLGDSDDADEEEPDGLVLGDQVDAVPTGAPNTGKGGVSTLVLGQLLAMPRRRNHN